MCSVSRSRRTASAKASTCSSIDTSAGDVATRVPWRACDRQSRLVSAMPSEDTSHIATSQPMATSCNASSRPIPEPPPVTTAIFPSKLFTAISLCGRRTPRLGGVWSRSRCRRGRRSPPGSVSSEFYGEQLVGAMGLRALLLVELVAQDRGMAVNLLAYPHDVAKRRMFGGHPPRREGKRVHLREVDVA